MALIDKASLLMVPSTYEAGKLYNVLPSGNRAPDSTDQNSGYDQTRADFDFDRGSNAAATRVNASGLIEKYRENLLLQSNQFDTTWGNSNTTETGGQADKDGGTTAWRVDTIAAAGRIQQSVSTSGVQTFSVYAKAGTYNFIDILAVGGSTPFGYFDLSTGSVGTTSNVIDANIQSVGGGWYRCAITFNDSAVTSARFYPVVADSDLTGTNGNIYIQDAQLESGLVATDYLESTSVTGKAGVLVDLPRINYDANGENGALLLEPSRANLIPQSEYLAIGWTYDNTSVISNSIVSPTGEISASKLLDNTTNALHRMYYITGTSASAHRFSIFLKKAEYSKVEMESLSGVTTNITYDLLNGTATSVGEIEPYGNDWYRCIFPMSNTSPSNAIQIRLVNNSNSNVFVGTGTSGVHMFGAQLEAGSYATSYIPTMGTSETRAADSCSVTGASDVIGTSEGAFFIDFIARADNTNSRAITITGSSQELLLFLESTGTGNIGIFSSTSGLRYIETGGASDKRYKIAYAWKANDYALYVNGVSFAVTQAASTFTGLDRIDLNQTQSGAEIGKNIVNQLLLFKTRLTNEELATLTTL